MANSLEAPEEEFQERCCSALLNLFSSTNTVELRNGINYISNSKTILNKIISKRFDFDDKTLSNYFDYIDWITFLKYNKSLNISIEVRKFIFRYIRKREFLFFHEFDPPPLFHPLSYLTIFERYFKSISDFKSKYNIYKHSSFLFINKLNRYCLSDKFPDENLIATEEFVALYYSSKIDFKWNKQFIEKYANKLDWTLLSCNSGLPLTYELIDAFTSYWNWTTLLYNPSLSLNIEFIEKYISLIDWNALSSTSGNFWTEELIDTFIHQWNWTSLCKNESIRWSLHFLQKYEQFIDWKTISGNPNLELSIETIDLYKEKFFWNGVEEEETYDDETGIYYDTIVVGYGISSNPSFSWNKDYMSRYKEYLDWKFIEYGNIHICWDMELIDLFSDNLSWSFILTDKPITDEFCKKILPSYEKGDVFSNLFIEDIIKGKIENISTLKLSHELLLKCTNCLDMNLVFRNKYIEWNFSIFVYLFNFYFFNTTLQESKVWSYRAKDDEEKLKNDRLYRRFIQRMHDLNLRTIDTKNEAVIEVLNIIASNPKIFKNIIGNHFTETNIDHALSGY